MVRLASIGAPMSPDEILAYESRVRMRQVVVAVIAGVCLIVASVMQLSGPHTKVDELTLDLLVANKRFPLDLIASVINARRRRWPSRGRWSSCSGRARARNPEKVRPYIRYIALVGGVLAAVAGVVYAIVVAIKVHEFATTGSQTYAEANHLTSGAGLLGLQLVGQLAALLVAVAFVLVSLQAMNQGLLTRFMGYLGMFAGALVLFQITQVPVVQTFWLLAVAYLVSGRWPTGVPPAWRSGRAEPWPVVGGDAGAPRRRDGRSPHAAGPRSRARRPAIEPEAAAAPANGRTRATTPKRKRKRRN